MSRIETIAEGVVLHLGDYREILPLLDPVDAIVTSPPYAQQRDYGRKVDDWRGLMAGICDAPMTERGQILVNLGLVHRDGEVITYWNPFLDDMRAAGWRHFGWYVWDQMSGMMGDWNGRLAPSHEFIFHFNRSARTVNKTKPTLGGRIHSGNLRTTDGTSKLKSHDGRPVQPTKIPDSVIRTVRETTTGPEAAHPARFPAAFAREMIGPFSDPAQIVCDPFMGSGTTGAAAVAMGRGFVGIELEPKYFDIARKRISDATKQKDMFFETPRPAEQLGLLDAAE
jgi:DNA modification methylase